MAEFTGVNLGMYFSLRYVVSDMYKVIWLVVRQVITLRIRLGREAAGGEREIG